ncbi:MAG: acyltransferase [Candidatus Krumholzibacteriia bacterium]
MNASPPFPFTDGSGSARRLGAGGMAVAVLAVAIEALLLDSTWLEARRSSLLAVVALALQQAKPYLVVALSVAACGWVLARSDDRQRASSPSPAWALVATAVLLATLAALHVPTLDELLLNGSLRSSGEVVETSGAGALRVQLPLQVVPLEEAGRLAEIDVAPARGPRDVRVRWEAVRTGPLDESARVELIGGGNLHDVTRDYRSLPEGVSMPLERTLRLGSDPARLRLRLAWDPPPPTTFFSADWGSDPGGFALDTGGADVAVREITTPDETGGSLLVVSGKHGPDGYTTFVLSGTEWRSHDLSPLVEAHGRLELVLDASDPPPWAVRLVGRSGSTEPVPLSSFRTERVSADRARYTLALRDFDWSTASPGSMVGMAMLLRGRPGPFRIGVEAARVVPAAAPASGCAIGATRTGHAGGPPVKGLLAAGVSGAAVESGIIARHPQAARLFAASLAIVGIVGGFRFAWLLVRRHALHVAAAALVGPIVLLVLDSWLPAFMSPRPEHVPLAMLLATGTAAVAGWRAGVRRPYGQRAIAASTIEVPTTPAVAERTAAITARLSWADAAKMLGILGIVGFHVTADAHGQAFGAFESTQRWVPVVGRALCQPLNSALFVIAAFFLLAHGLDRRDRSYRQVLGRRADRLLVPFALWSIIYLIFRHWKASAFGYQDAYREYLADGFAWLGFAVLGKAQYHLHFLPFLLALTLLFPLYRIAWRRPWAWLLALPVLLWAWSMLDGMIYRAGIEAEWRPYLLRATKTLGFAGFGIVAFALQRIHRDCIGRRTQLVLLAMSVAMLTAGMSVVLHHAFGEVEAGRWLPLDLAEHLARHLMPVAVFMLFMLAGESLPAWAGRLCKLNFGVFLVHPMLLDTLEILEQDSGWSPARIVPFNMAVVVGGSFLVAWLISRVPSLRWTIGLSRERDR